MGLEWLEWGPEQADWMKLWPDSLQVGFGPQLVREMGKDVLEARNPQRLMEWNHAHGAIGGSNCLPRLMMPVLGDVGSGRKFLLPDPCPAGLGLVKPGGCADPRVVGGYEVLLGGDPAEVEKEARTG